VKTVKVDVVFDVICPWCAIGERRLQQAIDAVSDRCRVEVTLHPFELNPEMPKEGADRAAFFAAKFGVGDRVRAMQERVRDTAAAEGLTFNFERSLRVPNTFDAHRVIWLAQKEGVGEGVTRALYHAYFTDGADIGDAKVLAAAAEKGGLPKARVVAFLASDEGALEVRTAERLVLEAGVTAVPVFIFDGERAVEGAQATAKLVAALDEAAGEVAGEETRS